MSFPHSVVQHKGNAFLKTAQIIHNKNNNDYIDILTLKGFFAYANLRKYAALGELLK